MSFGASAFGASSNPFTSTTPFGSTAAFGSTAPFGSTTPFGSTAAPSGFGAPSPAPAFGSAFAPSSSAYAAASTPFGAAPASTPFGSAPTSTPFGAPPSAPAPAPAFGSSAPFGAPPSSSAFPSGNPFAPTPAAAPAPSGLAPFATPGAALPPADGTAPSTRNPPWAISPLPDSSNSADPGKFVAISAMHAFSLHSIEELRVADYTRNDRGGDNPPPPSAGLPPTAPPTQPSTNPFQPTPLPPIFPPSTAPAPTTTAPFPSTQLPHAPTPAVPPLFPPSDPHPPPTTAPPGSIFQPASNIFLPSNNPTPSLPPHMPPTSNPTTTALLFPSTMPSIVSNQTTQPDTQYQQPAQTSTPLQASLTSNPFGTSALFAQTAPSVAPAAPYTPTAAAPSKPTSVIVSATRRPRGAEPFARPVSLGGRRADPGAGLFSASPMRPWGRDGSLFDVSTVLRPASAGQTSRFVAPWRTPAQADRAANIKKLVIEPVDDDPIFQAAAAFAAHPVRRPTSQRTDDGNPETDTRRASDDVEEVNAAPDPSLRTGVAPQDEQLRMRNAENTVPSNAAPNALPRDRRPMSLPASASIFNMAPSTPFAPNRLPTLLAAPENAPGGPDVVDLTGGPGSLDASDPRYVPYRESLEASLGAKQKDERVVEPPRRSPPVSENPDLYTQPDFETLADMSDDELARVPNFAVGVLGIGEVVWDGETDVRDLNLDEVVRMVPREVCVYPDPKTMPPVGHGLNKPARVSLHGIWKVDKSTRRAIKDARSTVAIVRRLKAHCENEGLTFLGYELRTGTWSFKAERF